MAVLLSQLVVACQALLDIDDIDFGDPQAGGTAGWAGGTSVGGAGGGAGMVVGGGGSGTGGAGASGGTGGTGGTAGSGGSGGADPLGPFSSPELVAELSHPSDDDDPTFTADLLELYFNTTRGGGPSGFWTSTRTSAADPWGAPTEALELNSTYGDTNCVVAPDGLTIWLSSARDGGGERDIYEASRPDRTSAWSTPAQVVELSSSGSDNLSAISGDGLTIVLSSDRDGGQGGDDLYVATRSTTSDPWSEPMPILELNTASNEGQAWLRPDALVLYFDSDRGGSGTDIYMTTRPTTGASWAIPVLVEELNSADEDSDAWLSPDMRYVMLTRGTAPRAIYQAYR